MTDAQIKQYFKKPKSLKEFSDKIGNDWKANEIQTAAINKGLIQTVLIVDEYGAETIKLVTTESPRHK